MARPLLFAVLALAACESSAWKPSEAPLEVAITTPSVTDEQVEAVMRAAERWRETIGSDVIRVTVAPGAAPRCGVVALTFEPMPGLANGTTLRGACRASIVLHATLPSEYMAVVAAHELGHALGLDHDERADSLMAASAPRHGGVITDAARLYVHRLLEH